MPFQEIQLTPNVGVNVEPTPAGNPTGIQSSNFIRWRANLPEKRGGCSLYINQPVNGVPCALKPWGDFEGINYLGIATNSAVLTYNANTSELRDISPQYVNSSLASPTYSTAVGSNLVTIVDTTAPSLTTFDSVQFNTPVAVGGLILDSIYPIVSSSVDTHTYVINAGYAATSNETTVSGTLIGFETFAGNASVIMVFPTQYQYNSIAVGDRIGFTVPTSVGGLTIVGQYIVTQILQDGFITFNAQYEASSSTPSGEPVFMNNGFTSLTYWISASPGPPPPALERKEGLLNTIPETSKGSRFKSSLSSTYTADNWWLDSIESTLVACAQNGPIFTFSPIGGYQDLSIINSGPPASTGAFVAMPSGQIMAWGTSDYLDPVQNPLYIRWSDSTNFTNWNIGGSSTAGFYTIPTGSKIVRGIQAQNQQFWFTDIDVYSAQYTSYPTFFSFLKIGNGCGLLSPRGVGIVNNSVYWMSQEQFFVMQSGSAPQPLPCSVWDFIFQNSTQDKLAKTVCGGNSLFNEVIWYFPSNASSDGTPDAYVCYNTLYNEWDFGYLGRTAWTDQSVLGFPIGSDENGWIYQHETSYDLAVGDTTVPINASMQTGYSSLTNGEDLIFVDWVLPYMKWGTYSGSPTANLNFTFYVTDYAGQTPRVYGPFTASEQTPFISPRFRGRFMSVKIESDDLGSFWRLGSIRFRFAPSGRR